MSSGRNRSPPLPPGRRGARGGRPSSAPGGGRRAARARPSSAPGAGSRGGARCPRRSARGAGAHPLLTRRSRRLCEARAWPGRPVPLGLLGGAHGGAQAHRRRRSMAPGAGARDRTKTPTARRDRRGGLVVSCDPRGARRDPHPAGAWSSVAPAISGDPGPPAGTASRPPPLNRPDQHHPAATESPPAAPWPHREGRRGHRHPATTKIAHRGAQSERRGARGTAGVRQHGPRARDARARGGRATVHPHPEGVRYGSTTYVRPSHPPP